MADKNFTGSWDDFDDDDDELDQEEIELFEWFDSFIEYLKTFPEHEGHETYMLNPSTASRMIRAVKLLKQIANSFNDVKINWGQSEIAKCWGYITIEGKNIEFFNTEILAGIIELASGTSIYPLASDKIRITFDFEDFFIPI